MASTRPPAVAGYFYPAAEDELRTVVAEHLDAAEPLAPALRSRRPKAVIAPHAGYIYSGPIAGSAYGGVRPYGRDVQCIVLLGPAHRVPLRGLAASSAAAFATPLGDVDVDRSRVDAVLDLPQVCVDDEAHRLEHSLEVQLPFVQTVFPEVAVVPLAVGDASTESVAQVLDRLWGGAETLVIVSSDLSHYHDYATACRLDRATADAIERLRPDELEPDSACGRTAVRGLLEVARRRGLQAHTIDLRNSGDTAGGRDEVVGYGAFLFN